jgi:hypothetical protein
MLIKWCCRDNARGAPPSDATPYELVTRGLEVSKGVGIGETGDRHHHTVGQVGETRFDDLVGLHARNDTHVRALDRSHRRAVSVSQAIRELTEALEASSDDE